jgi:protein-lysine N-methyltransferase EEF2KMT
MKKKKKILFTTVGSFPIKVLSHFLLFGMYYFLCFSVFVLYRMTWNSGPHACDGPWAKWWYHDVHQSTGWVTTTNPNEATTTTISSSKKRYRILPSEYKDTLKASYPAYDYLKRLSKSYIERRTPIPMEQIYEDRRNEHVLVYIGTPTTTTPPSSGVGTINNNSVLGGGRLVPREMARISPFDSAVQGGDACWEGIRIYRGTILHLNQHLKRLIKSAKALGFDMNQHKMHTMEEIKECIFHVLAANNIRDEAHIRLTLTRGEKCTSSMNPKFNIYGTTLIILPEYKPVVGGITTYNNEVGISLISASQRRNNCQTVDSKIHHNK